PTSNESATTATSGRRNRELPTAESRPTEPTLSLGRPNTLFGFPSVRPRDAHERTHTRRQGRPRGPALSAAARESRQLDAVRWTVVTRSTASVGNDLALTGNDSAVVDCPASRPFTNADVVSS